MAESPGHKLSLAGARESGSHVDGNTPRRQSLISPPKQRSTAYCAHAPEPYAAMASRGDWSTELWDIFAQPGGPNMCCLSLWCPCIQYGLLLEQLPMGSVTCGGSVAGGCALFALLWLLGDLLGAALLIKVATLPCTALVHAQTRGYIRCKYGIQSHPLHDFMITWCCAPCALCQEAREVVIRQAAEREDQARTPLLMSRAGSVHERDRDRADVSIRSSVASGGGGGGGVRLHLSGQQQPSPLAAAGSAPEPTSPRADGLAAPMSPLSEARSAPVALGKPSTPSMLPPIGGLAGAQGQHGAASPTHHHHSHNNHHHHNHNHQLSSPLRNSGRAPAAVADGAPTSAAAVTAVGVMADDGAAVQRADAPVLPQAYGHVSG